MQHSFHAKTITELHNDICHYMVHASADELDVVSSVDVAIHNVIAEADSMEWDFNLKNLWLTESRWSMMVGQYVPAEDFIQWIEKCTRYIGTSNRGIALMRTRVILPRGGAQFGNKESRRWGSCMLGISYKAVPRPQITLYSRTSYMGYLSGLDISIAWMCARYLANELGVPVESFSFVWMNEAMQYHNFKSMAYLLNHPDPEMRKKYRRWLRFSDAKLKETGDYDYVNSRPALKLSRSWLRKLIQADQRGDTLGDMTYNTYRRIRRRYHTEVLGYEKAKEFEGWSYHKKGPLAGEKKEFFQAYHPLDDCWISDLDFKKIKIPFIAGKGNYSSPMPVFTDTSLDLDDDDI